MVRLLGQTTTHKWVAVVRLVMAVLVGGMVVAVAVATAHVAAEHPQIWAHNSIGKARQTPVTRL